MNNEQMLLTDKQVEELQSLYQNHLGKEISKEEAYEQGVKLLTLVKIVYSPLTEDEYNEIEKNGDNQQCFA